MMKRLFSALVLIFLATMSLCASNRNAPKLLYGNAQFVLEDALVYFNLDYSHAVEVEYGHDGVTLDTVKGHGIFEEGNATHDQVLPNFISMYAKNYNKFASKAKYPTRMTLNRNEAKYELTLEIDTIDTGSAVAKALVPLAMSKGNVIFSGSMIVREIATGNTVFKMSCSQLTTVAGGALPAARLYTVLGIEFSFQYLFNVDTFTFTVKEKKGYNIPYLYPDGQK